MPEIVGDIWFNSKELKLSSLKNKIVLVDFWTYSCINCLRTIPHYRKIWDKYNAHDFILIGIHTPEFEFEKDSQNVERAIKELKVEWPVVLDNDYINWNNFANHYWPAEYLADKSGNIIYTHFGEGDYAKTENEIRKLLGLAKDPLLYKQEEHERGKVCFIPTPELYLGYQRGFLVNNPSGYSEDIAESYEPEYPFREDSIALAGTFRAKPEYVESVEENSKIMLNFNATEVNLVLAPVGEKAVIEVLYDEKPLLHEITGKDVQPGGKVEIDEPKMYNLLKSNTLHKGILSVIAKENNFQAFAFTFSGCED